MGVRLTHSQGMVQAFSGTERLLLLIKELSADAANMDVFFNLNMLVALDGAVLGYLTKAAGFALGQRSVERCPMPLVLSQSINLLYRLSFLVHLDFRHNGSSRLRRFLHFMRALVRDIAAQSLLKLLAIAGKNPRIVMLRVRRKRRPCGCSAGSWLQARYRYG